MSMGAEDGDKIWGWWVRSELTSLFDWNVRPNCWQSSCTVGDVGTRTKRGMGGETLQESDAKFISTVVSDDV